MCFYMDQSNISILCTDTAVASVNVRALNVSEVVLWCMCALVHLMLFWCFFSVVVHYFLFQHTRKDVSFM